MLDVSEHLEQVHGSRIPTSPARFPECSFYCQASGGVYAGETVDTLVDGSEDKIGTVPTFPSVESLTLFFSPQRKKI